MFNGRLVAVVVGVVMCCGVQASARVFEISYEGFVSQLTDGSGLFGQAIAGSPFSLTFRVNTARGLLFHGGGGYTDGVTLVGGTNNAADPGEPTITLSPVSARLSIGSKTLAFKGVNFGEADAYNSYFGEIVGRPDEDFSALYQVVRDSRSGARPLTDFLEASVGFPVVPFSDVFTPLSAMIDGTTVTATADFSYDLQDRATGRDIGASGTLNPTHVVVTDVPEPRGTEWSLLFAGFAVACVGHSAMRHARKSVCGGRQH